MKKNIKIGRSRSSDCRIDDMSVSGSHAIVVLNDDGHTALLQDLGSTNGTYVNNRRISGEAVVNGTDAIRLGNYNTSLAEIVRLANNPAATAQPQPAAPQPAVHQPQPAAHQPYQPQPAAPQPQPAEEEDMRKADRKLALRVILPLAVLLIAFGSYFYLKRGGGSGHGGVMSQEKIYENYNSAVCWVLTNYGYRIILDGRDVTAEICEVFGVQPSSLVHIENGALVPGTGAAQATAFFITDDGKLGTNLHVTRPWLFSNEADQITALANQVVTYLAMHADPSFLRSTLKVEGVATSYQIVPNRMAFSDRNAIECIEYRGHNDINKDVAILQTVDHRVPEQVERIIDISKADLGPEALKVGKSIYTIGYPYGVGLALTDNRVLTNQIHHGAITQERDDYEFGHDAVTAHGSSGSPVLNDHGQLVGVINAGLEGDQGFNMAIKAKHLVGLLD